MQTNRFLDASLRTSVLAVAAGLLLLAGCGDDEGLAPHDELVLTQGEAAGQSGYLAWALVRIAPEFLDDPTHPIDIGKSAEKNVYTMVFTGAIVGSCEADFRTSEGGAPAPWNTAGYAHMYTVADNPLTFYPFDPGDDASPITLVFDLEADITQGTPDTAVVSGGGSIGNGSFTTEFTLDGLTVVGSGYPTGGEMTVDIGPYTAHIEYDGGSQAMMIIDGTTYFIDLETGETTVVPPTF